MVFESIVVDLLNRILGDYFENLDTSQLKLGIWGGDVVLKNLLLKNSVMDELGLPFKVIVGKLGSLTMKIPWQGLYTNPVELKLDNLYLLVTPSYSVVYNEEAEEAAAQALKKKEIERIEEARRKEQSRALEGPPAEHTDSFSEKMVSQIIKNVQISIESIHIRYEDNVTKPQSPFGFGVILKTLKVETTDEDWKPTIIKDSSDQIVHKMAKLEGLSVYWNSNTTILQKKETMLDILDTMKDLVEKEKAPLTYVLGPISSEAKVQLNPSPERGISPFSLPKVLIDVVINELLLGMTNSQFQDIMELVESLDFMSRAQFYRKYRPAITTHRGNYKAWWKFAYRCIVEEEVRRRRTNWSWDHMKRHRQLCTTYADAYYAKLTSKKVKQETEVKVSHSEKELDVFNITLVRKQVELKVEKLGKSQEKQAAEAGGWFSGWSGWFSGSTENKSAEATGNIVHKIEEALTPAEKAKLYAAIDYSENSLPLDFPDPYIEYLFKFNLRKLRLVIQESSTANMPEQTILMLDILNVETIISSRPVRKGLKVEIFMGGIEAVGLKNTSSTEIPHIIASKAKSGSHLFKVAYECNPLDSKLDKLTRLNVSTQALEIVYHAKTITHLVKCFSLPAEMQLEKLQAAAASTFNEWKEQSAAGLQYMLESRPEIEVDIDMVAPYILIPQNGRLDTKGSVLVMDLGEILVKSKARRGTPKPDRKSYESDDKFLSAVMNKSYDSFIVTLKDFLVFLALPGEDYISILSKHYDKNSSFIVAEHLIKSDEFIVKLDQCLVSDDPRLPKLKLEGNLPLLDSDITERRVLELLKLLTTLPLPQSDGPAVTSGAPVAHNPAVSESYAISHITYGAKPKKDKHIVEFIEMYLLFTIKAIKVRISRVNDQKVAVPLAMCEIHQLEAKMTNKTYSSIIDVAVGGLTMCALQNSAPDMNGPLYLLKTPMTEGFGTHLLKVHMFTILPNCPKELMTEDVKQFIKADISSLDVILHQEALTNFMAFFEQLTSVVAKEVETSDIETISLKRVDDKAKPTQVSKIEATRRAVAKKVTDPNDILLKIEAKMDRLTVQLSTETKNLMRTVFAKLDFSMKQQLKKTEMTIDLTELTLLNLDPMTKYKKIVTVEADKVVSINVVMYDDATKGKHFLDMNKHDMKVRVVTGSPKVYYLSGFVDDVLEFIDTFQEAKEAVINASAAAADVARENVENVYASASRILLDVDLQAPIIIVPRNENSNAALLADLGRLKVTNSFKKQTFENSSDVVIVDAMRVDLNDMKISRVVIGLEKQKIVSEILLLDPVNCHVSVQRNLSAEWYQDIPSIKIDGNLKHVFVRCGNEDYQVIMACLNENIAGKPKPPQPGSQKQIQQQTAKAEAELKLARRRSVKSNTKMAAPSTSSIQIITGVDSSDNIIFTNIDMNILIERMGLVMYQGNSNLEHKTGLVVRNFKTAFADFSIVNISIRFEGYSNGDMYCPITIDDINLEDVRPGERAITNLIQKKLDETVSDSKKTASVIRFSYKQDKKQGVLMNIDTTSLTIVLCVDYLLQLSQFFALNYEEDVNHPNFVVKTEKFSTSDDPAPVREITADKKLPTAKSSEEVVPFSAFYNLAETEIILVESMDSIYSNALLLHCEVNLRQKTVDSKENTMGTINNIRLSTCNYNPENRSQTLAEVISPSSITLVMNRSSEMGTLIDINLSDIFIRLTAGTLELLLKISSGISVSQDPENGLLMDDHSQLWERKANDEMNLWFLKPDVTVEVGEEALEAIEDTNQPIEIRFDSTHDLEIKERIVVESGCILVTFETGVGANTLPMLLIETNFDLQAYDWSSKFQVGGRMKFEAAYYNPIYGMWEYLIEPVESRSHGRVSHRPWEMLFEYTTAENADNSAELSLLSPEEAQAAKSHVSITIQSNDILELTVTKTGLQVINTLAEEFHAAVKSLVSQRDVSTAAYTVVNDTGTDIRIMLENSSFLLYRDTRNYEQVLLKAGTSINFALADSFDMTKHHVSILREQEGHEERILKIEIPEFNFEHQVPVNRAEKRYYSLDRRADFGLHYALLVDTTVKDCSKIVTFRSIVQIISELDVAVDVYYMDGGSKVLKLLGTVDAGQKLNIPLLGVYTRTCELFFAPEGYCISAMPFIWMTLMTELHASTHISCPPREGGNENFNIKVVGEVKQAFHENTARKSLASQGCYIHLRPPFIINNLLPCKLGYYVDNIHLIKVAEEGATLQICNIEVDKNENYEFTLRIPSYDGQSWACDIVIVKATSDLSQWLFKSEEIKHNSLTLGIHTEISDQTVTFHVYCPFWMINRTGRNLCYKGTEKDAAKIQHPDDFTTPLMFTFQGKAFLAKKNAYVKVEDSDWSNKFSLDVAGSSGILTCKSPQMNYEIGVEFQLNSWGLTRTVIFTPRYYLINQCSFDLIVKETDKPEYSNLVKAGTCVGFWPRSPTSFLTASVEGTSEESKPFSYDRVNHVLLKLVNKYGGLHVDVHVAEARSLVTISEMIVGQAPLLIVNATNKVYIEVTEKGVSDSRAVAPGYSQYLTWDDPIGERTMVWWPATTGKKTEFTDKLQEDNCGTFIYKEDANKEETYYWISFLNGLQRVMLYTADLELVTYLQAARDNKQVTAEYTVMLQGIGLSIVDNEQFKEIIYMRIASSGTVWESQKEGKSKRFRPLPAEKSQAIEVAYQNFLNEKVISTTTKSHITLDSGIEVDFLDLKMYKPFVRQMRRSFQTGIWIHYKTSPHTAQFHAKIHRLQIDNQMSDCIFRVLLAPVPPPKSVATKSNPQKPFAEISIMQRITAHSSVIQYKYFKVLVQEFHVRLDYSLITSIFDLLSPSNSTTKSEQLKEQYRKEYTEACTSVSDCNARQIKSQGQKHFYDFLHFSPLKVHISFSMGGSTQSSSNFLNIMMKSVGVTVTEIQDVVFKLSCLELRHMFVSGDQLYTEIYSHYSSQALKQLYVLVLGLDVLGNPFGLAMGVKEGVQAFFYEPFQGAIQGPGEFAEGLALGVRHLLGSTVGGTFGAFSKITGTLGKGIAALTLDDEYQKKRRENISRRPQDVTEGLARSGKGLVMGVFDGITGVVTQPVRGAREGGVGGFFKGLAKGTIGVVARPVAGVVDFASGSFDAVKKATSTSEDVRRMRPPRFVPTESILQPYVCHEAEGVQLLHDLEKGKYVHTDTYMAHALINPHGIFVVFLTDRRIMYLKRDDLFGGWDVVWTHMWEDFLGIPDIVEKGIVFKLKLSQKKKLLRPQHMKELLVPVYNADVCTWLMSKIETAMRPPDSAVVAEEEEFVMA